MKFNLTFLRQKQRSFLLLLVLSVFSLFLLSAPVIEIFADNQLYFTSINDKLLSLRDDTMPQWIDGQIYVPFTSFDQNTTGISSGTYAWKQGNLVTVAQGDLALTFDLGTGLCYDEHNRTNYPYQAVVRDGVAFLPVAGVCNFFQIAYSYQKISHGYLLRIKGAGTYLTDSSFIDAAEESFLQAIEEYNLLKNPPPVIAPTPEPEPEILTEEEEEEEIVVETPYLLGIDMVDYNVNIPTVLAERHISAVFFFTPEQLENQGNLLRHLLSLGHFIGLEISGQSLVSLTLVEEKIALGNDYLYQQTRSQSQMIFLGELGEITGVDGLPVGGQGDTGGQLSGIGHALQEKGYVLWQGGAAETLTSVAQTLSRMTSGVSLTYLTLEQTEESGLYLQSFLNQAHDKGFYPVTPREDRF